jgi:signal transduction histidine kinase
MESDNEQRENFRTDLRNLTKISQITTSFSDSKEALDRFVPLARNILLFDSIVLYQANQKQTEQEVIYARAIGRGKTQIDDLNWGDSITARLFDRKKIILQKPAENGATDRINQPFLLGVPLSVHYQRPAAVILIRFGGPAFTNQDKPGAQFIADQLSLILDHDSLHHQIISSEKNFSDDDLLAMLAHELLTPIGFIKGYTTTLMRPDIQLPEDTQKEFLSVIDEETDHLQELINDMLDSARLQNGTMPMVNQPILMDGLIKDSILHIKQFYPETVIDFQKGSGIPSIHGDPRRIKQVIENLFTNAIKYAPGSPIHVKLERSGRDIHLTVTDEGPGMSSDVLSKLFNKYYRAPVTQNIHGSGLGLFICREIIHAHNGEISITSKPGIGTTASILLPAGQKNEK